MNFKNNGALLTVLLIVFVDILGFTIMIPLLPFYAESLGATPFVVGMLSSIYGLCSLISGPILGDLSDRYGRRKILLLSQIGTCIGFIILALSRILWIVFLSRIIDGITAGNLTVAQAYISDVTKPKDRTRAMGMIGASFGLGFILGPAISGVLVQFGHAAPIWASAALSFFSIIGTTVFLKDVKNRQEIKLNTDKGIIKQFKKYFLLLNNPVLKECFSVFFIFSISFSLYMSGFALYCERALVWNGHPFTAKEVGLLLSYVGVISLLIQLLLMGYLVRKLGEIKIMLLGFTSTALALLIMGFAPLLSIFLVGITINSFGNAILRPAISGMLSQNANPAQQGLVFGLNQTLMSIAQIVCPLISGFLIEKEWTLFWCLSISAISFLGLFVGKLASTKINYSKITV
ncbi:MAG: MFS transporter [Bacteriovorax sp.]|nr:MFS transporter [Bacteriovorax sp.]